MDNEELLRAGECSKRACCIEPMGHAGPCTGDADDPQRQLQEARQETRELAEKGYEASVWGWHKERERLLSALQQAQGEGNGD